MVVNKQVGPEFSIVQTLNGPTHNSITEKDDFALNPSESLQYRDNNYITDRNRYIYYIL